MLRLLLAALVAGVCATNSSVRDGAALPSDHTEQSFARSPTTTANASVYIVKLTRARVGDARESRMRPGHFGDDGDSRTAAAHTAVAMQEFRRLRHREVVDGEKLSAAEDARLEALWQANEEACDLIDEELEAQARALHAHYMHMHMHAHARTARTHTHRHRHALHAHARFTHASHAHVARTACALRIRGVGTHPSPTQPSPIIPAPSSQPHLSPTILAPAPSC